MKMKISLNKIVSLTVALLVLGTVIVFPVVQATDNAQTVKFVKQVTDRGYNVGYNDYSDYDWSVFGDNLIPDPTVNEFKKDQQGNWLDANGQITTDLAARVYDDYAIAPNTAVINSNAIWDKYVDQYQFTHSVAQYSGPKDWNRITADSTLSHTNDGSGALMGNNHWFALPKMTANKAYIVTFWVRYKDSANSYTGQIYLGHSFTDTNNHTSSEQIESWDVVDAAPWWSSITNEWKRVTFVVRTSDSSDCNPIVYFYTGGKIALVDDFAMFEISTADAEEYKTNKKISKPVIPAEFTQLAYSGQTLNDYSGYRWDKFGTNLIKDPTVNNFVDDGNGGKVYGEYATTANENVNEDYWWDKYLDRYHGLTAWYPTISNCQAPQLLSPNKRGYVKPTGSLTDDGTGVIDATAKTSGDYALPLPNAKANTYYLLKFNVKCVNSGGNINLANGQTLLTDTANSGSKPLLSGWSLGANRQTTAAVVFYTGTKVYNNLNLWVWSCPASFDDFGMYEITKEQYDTFKTNGAVTKPYVAPEFTQITLDGNNTPYDYSWFNWKTLGENLVPDSTVANFQNGEYATYAEPVKQSGGSYDHGTVNNDAWWDKYIEKYHGFNLWYQQKLDGKTNECWKVLASLKQRGMLQTTGSLTDDGSGVIKTKSGDSVIPLPALESESYYIIKFDFKASTAGGGMINITNGTTYLTSNNSNNEGILQPYYFGSNLTNVVIVVYTGSKSYATPNIWTYGTEAYIDNVGVYKIDETLANKYKNDGTLGNPNADKPQTPAVIQTTYNSAGKKNDYSKIDWGMLGENIIPDPTISNFDGDEYATYATPVKEGGSYTHGAVNKDAWWDKYLDNYHGFNLWYQKKLDGATNEGWKALASPKQRGEVLSTGSLTEDGSGVIKAKPGSLAYPLPSLKPFTYYCVKFTVYFEQANNSPDFTLYKDAVTPIATNILDFSKLGKGTHDVTFMIYTGAKSYSDPFFMFYSGVEAKLDDFAVYPLDWDYGSLSMESGKLLPISSVDVNASAEFTPAIEDFDFGADGDVVEDGSFEQNADAVANSTAKFGDKVLPVAAERELEISVKPNAYYMVSVWIKTDSTENGKNINLSIADSKGVLKSANVAASAEWNQSSFIVYTAFSTKLKLIIGRGTLAATTALYADGLSAVELPVEITDACYALDTYVDGTYDPDRVDTAAVVFGANNIYKTLISPVTGEKYKDMYVKYDELCKVLVKVNQGFAPSGYGSRENPSSLTCLDEDNLIADGACGNAAYWGASDTVNSEYLEITTEYSKSGTALKFTGGKTPSGEAIVYKKRITNLKPNTTYYLRIEGMGLGKIISDADFGFMDTTYGKELENPLSEHRQSSGVWKATFKQRNNFKCQDGTWYTRVYEFNTESNTELDFFIRGTVGTVYYDDIKLFEQSKAYSITQTGGVESMTTLNDEEAVFACADKDNLITNGKFTDGETFWKDFKGMGSFVEVATSEGNKMLHFKGNDLAYHYLPWVNVKADVTYTFSFWMKNLNGERSNISFVSESNHHGAVKVQSIAEKYGEWQLVSVKFICHEDNRVALGIFNRDGEAAIDNVRLFESSKGLAEITMAQDMPVGGNTFTDSVLGSDGVQQQETEDEPEIEVEEEIEEESDEEIDEENEDKENKEDTVEVVTKKRRKKIITVGGIPTYVIVLICVGAAVLVGAGIFFIIFFKKKKSKKQNN